MTKIIMHGCNGKMGRMITDLVREDRDIEIVAGVDQYRAVANEYPVAASIGECDTEADVIVDFSNASSVEALLEYAVGHNLPVVLCTTGLSDGQLKLVADSSRKIAILKSANMSLGINLLLKLLKEAAPVLAGEGFDIEIVEKHHNQKLDAPSGTAIAMADAINSAFAEDGENGPFNYVYDRSGYRQKRDSMEIGISAVRGGNIVGQHDVYFAGCDEIVTFSHMATSRAVFAKGAIAAAKFLKGRKPGMYDMSDVIAGE